MVWVRLEPVELQHLTFVGEYYVLPPDKAWRIARTRTESASCRPILMISTSLWVQTLLCGRSKRDFS